MKILTFLWWFFDFLFPRDARVRGLEKMSADELARSLPAAKKFENLPEEIARHRTFALFDYRDEVVKQIIWEIKYRRNVELARKVAGCLGDKALAVLASVSVSIPITPGSKYVVIPIPSSGRRRRWRGFNQTEIIASEVVKYLDSGTGAHRFSYKDRVLAKVRETVPQSSLRDRHLRLENLRGAYDLGGDGVTELVCGQNVILIDDVITTGATMREAVRVLEGAGVREIVCLGVAH